MIHENSCTCTKNKEPSRKIQPFSIGNWSSKDNGSDLSIEMSRYKLTEIRLAKHRNPLYLFLKSKFFKIHS